MTKRKVRERHVHVALSKDKILSTLKATKAESLEVDIPEWGGVVHLRRMTAAHSLDIDYMDNGPDKAKTALLYSIVDENSVPLFANRAELDEVLDVSPGTVLTKFLDALATIRGATVEDAKENFTETPA